MDVVDGSLAWFAWFASARLSLSCGVDGMEYGRLTPTVESRERPDISVGTWGSRPLNPWNRQ
jgi:hypothetical protein